MNLVILIFIKTIFFCNQSDMSQLIKFLTQMEKEKNTKFGKSSNASIRVGDQSLRHGKIVLNISLLF